MTGSILKFKKLCMALVLAVITSIPQIFGNFFWGGSYLCSASLSSLSGKPMMSPTDLIVSSNNVLGSHSLLKEKNWNEP